jgi:parallel beta-helix repeat protein
MRRNMSLLLGLMLCTCAVAIVDMNIDMITSKGSAATLYVGTGPGNYTTIQFAIDMAQPGDTVFVYSKQYNETLLIDKTLTLMGEDKETTIINGLGNTYGIHLSNADYINVSGFTVHSAQYNIQLSNVDHAIISDNVFRYGQPNIQLLNSDFTTITENIIEEATGNAMIMTTSNHSMVLDNQFVGNEKGLLITSHSSHNIVKNNSMNSTTNKSISLVDGSHGNIVEGNQISGYEFGILVYEVDGTTIKNNEISDCGWGMRLLDLLGITLTDNIFSDNDIAIQLRSASAQIENCTIQDSVSNDFDIDDPDAYSPTVTLIDTNFDQSKVIIGDDSSTLEVKWFLQVSIVDEFDNPLSGLPVRVKDNENGTYDENFLTDSEGQVSWIPLTEFFQTQSQKTYHTPYNISAFNTTGQGYAIPEVSVDSSKEVTVKVYFDTDDDGIRDIDDKFPHDSTEWKDTDKDGVGDNSDDFPLDANETMDSDGDGVGDNADVFPNDPLETMDTDGDGFGDNSDDFPYDPDEWNDADGDGHGDNEDEFPDDAKEWRDSDGDGIGDNSDFLPQLDNSVFLLIIAVIIFIIIVLFALFRPKSKKKTKEEEEEVVTEEEGGEAVELPEEDEVEDEEESP